MTINIITGGAGYIGSHVAHELLLRGEEVVIVDNFSNSDMTNVNYLEKVAGDLVSSACVDILDLPKLTDVFRSAADADEHVRVVHCAGLKSVAESQRNPVGYYRNNVGGLINVLAAMEDNLIREIVFSSSATVYGTPDSSCVTETDDTSIQDSVYGQTKAACERILTSVHNEDWRIAILRYFNPIGADPSGMLSESASNPNNVVPLLCVRAHEGFPFSIFGNDYPTPDGTCQRDYIHVSDLAQAHVAALDAIHNYSNNIIVANIGVGRPVSVLELMTAFNSCLSHPREIVYVPRREGDVSAVYADPSYAKQVLNWSPEHTDVTDMCRDAIRAYTMRYNAKL